MRSVFIFTCFLCYFAFTAISSSAQEGDASKIAKILKQILPTKFHTFKIEKTNQDEVLKTLGKPDLQEKNQFYYQNQKIKYPIQISFGPEKKIAKIYYRFIGTESLQGFKDFENIFKRSDKQEIKTKNPNEYGLFFKIQVQEENRTLSLTFRTNAKESLYSMELK